MAIVRHHGVLNNDDIHVAYDVARRMLNLFGAARLAAAQQMMDQATELADPASDPQQWQRVTHQAREALQDALELDKLLADYWNARIEADPTLAAAKPPRLAEIYHNLALLDRLMGDPAAAQEHAHWP